jgi:hypothetical protein
VELSVWYFAVKGLAYAAWIYVGLSVFGRGQRHHVPLALGLGALRLLMGLGFGIVIWLAGSAVFQGVSEISDGSSSLVPSITTYLAVYVPVRWIEWGIFEVLLNRESRSARGFFLGAGSRTRRWRLGGIAISCLADIPVIYSLGGVIPVGRFMC